MSASITSAPTTGRLDSRRWWALAAMSLAALPAPEITAVSEIEAVGESLGELVVPDLP